MDLLFVNEVSKRNDIYQTIAYNESNPNIFRFLFLDYPGLRYRGFRLKMGYRGLKNSK